jgi:hypothetical protein
MQDGAVKYEEMDALDRFASAAVSGILAREVAKRAVDIAVATVMERRRCVLRETAGVR